MSPLSKAMGDPYDRMLSPEDIMRHQEIENAERERLHHESRLRNLTLRKAVQEASEAMTWILDESMHAPATIVTGLRLRGMGILLVFLASILLLIDALIE
jgi:hypothetical protein